MNCIAAIEVIHSSRSALLAGKRHAEPSYENQWDLISRAKSIAI